MWLRPEAAVDNTHIQQPMTSHYPNLCIHDNANFTLVAVVEFSKKILRILEHAFQIAMVEFSKKIL